MHTLVIYAHPISESSAGIAARIVASRPAIPLSPSSASVSSVGTSQRLAVQSYLARGFIGYGIVTEMIVGAPGAGKGIVPVAVLLYADESPPLAAMVVTITRKQ